MRGHPLASDLGIIGASRPFRETLDLLARYAVCDVPVLILGETGTGKELVARALHYWSERRAKPFVPVNCGTLPDALIENELFGHGRGAFTDARSSQKGLIALADGGTLLLDEVDSLSPRAQVALLRFLQDKQYRPLGSETTATADVRVVAATNADVTTLVERGLIRRDLLFRLDVVAIRIPPLRERGRDILTLAEHYLRSFSARYGKRPPRIDAALADKLEAYAWPGNVRELENAMHRAAILAQDGRIADLALGGAGGSASVAEGGARPDLPVDFGGGLRVARERHQAQFERAYVDWLLRQTGGNVSAAARAAGTERRHLGRIIKRAGVLPETFRD